MTSLMAANLRKAEVRVKLEQKFAALYAGKFAVDAGLKRGKINIAILEQGASILKQLNNETNDE